MADYRVIRMAGIALLAGSISLSGPAHATTIQQAGSIYGHNLIVNGSAEAGPGGMNDGAHIPPPGWKDPGSKGYAALVVASYSGSGLDLSPTTPGPTNRGKNYFYGGASGGKNTSAQQIVTIAAGGTAIDAGKISFVLSGWLGGLGTQRDYATLRATFLNASGQVVGSAVLGPVTKSIRKGITELVRQQITKQVPAQARTVQVDLIMKFFDGSDNDGMADNLSLVLSPSAIS